MSPPGHMVNAYCCYSWSAESWICQMYRSSPITITIFICFYIVRMVTKLASSWPSTCDKIHSLRLSHTLKPILNFSFSFLLCIGNILNQNCSHGLMSMINMKHKDIMLLVIQPFKKHTLNILYILCVCTFYSAMKLSSVKWNLG